MILEALYRLAEHEQLMSDPDFEFKPVAWLVRVDDGGRLLGIEGTHYLAASAGNKRARPQAKSIRVPRPLKPTRTSGDWAAFFCDKAEYALGRDPEQDPKKRRAPAKVDARFSLFREQVTACLEATSDEGVLAVSKLLEDLASGAQSVTLPEECAPNDLFAFVYAPDVDRAVHERPKVREYWKSQRKVRNDGKPVVRCLITGEPISELGNVPQLKNMPGKNTAKGISLVSFNKAAFESHGWSGNQNAPISRDAAEAIATALNRLLHPAFPDPRPEHRGETLAQRNFRISADTVVCFWASESSVDGFVDALTHLFNPDDPAVIGEAYRSLWRGRRAPINDTARFYALTITGTQGRAILRDWLESSVKDVSAHLAGYFADLEIVRNTPPPKGKELPPQIPLNLLLTSLAPLGRSENVPAPLAAQFVHAALRGTRYPLAVLQKALERTRAEIGKTGWADLARRDARAALIKAVLRRNYQQEMKPNMDPQNNAPGYRLGRLIAVLERLQQTALGDVNATVIDRFFGAASATPQAVFPRLLKNARHHARKAGDDPRLAGTSSWLDRQIDAILAPLSVQQHRQGLPYTGFPRHLDLEQQGLFVLGYHQQRHWLWMSKEERERWDGEQETAPAA